MKIIFYIWQLPQHILALFILFFIQSSNHFKYKTSCIYLCKQKISVSLGQYIIINKQYYSEKIKQHEYGHSIQSLFFGPLYLLIIGAPSMTINILTRYGALKPAMYYTYWPESWADTLGCVT